MEDDWGLMGVLEEQLAQDIDHDRQGNKGQCSDRAKV